MELTFYTFKLNLFHLIDWNIKGYTTSGCKDTGILKHQTLWQLHSTSLWSVVLNSAFFKGWDFIQLIFITISDWFLIYFLQQWSFYSNSTKVHVIPDKCTCLMFVLVRHLSQSDICTSPTFVPVRHLYQSDICTSPIYVPVRHLSQSDICTSPTFVPVRRLYIVLSNLCNVRRLWVWRLYWYPFNIS